MLVIVLTDKSRLICTWWWELPAEFAVFATSRYGFYDIYQPRDYVARSINPIATFSSVYNLYLS